MDFLKKRLKRLTSMGLALLLSASAFPATAFAASDSTSTLAEVTAKYIDAENGKEIAEQEIYSVTHEERQPQEIENYTYVDYTENVVEIEGGNHAQFGNYGPQKGDLPATISAQDQQAQTVEAIANFLEKQRQKVK